MNVANKFYVHYKATYQNQWTGPGYYKSSAKNAMRLARTEINMAYRTAEQVRWQQFDFVVGYEVKTTQNGRHEEDICDALAGKYPKDFKFVGWHPQCMCYAIPILKTEKEFYEYDPDAPKPSVNEITDVPQGFKDWVMDNEERIERAEERGKLPYFIKDNRAAVQGVLQPIVREEGRKKTPQEIADERHAARTQEDVADNNSREEIYDAQISDFRPEIRIPYNRDIEIILQGGELKDKDDRGTLLKYLDALDTLGNGKRLKVRDDDWAVDFTSDGIREQLSQNRYSASDIKHILSVLKSGVNKGVSELSNVPLLKDIYRIKTFDASVLPLEWQKEIMGVFDCPQTL